MELLFVIFIIGYLIGFWLTVLACANFDDKMENDIPFAIKVLVPLFVSLGWPFIWISVFMKIHKDEK